MNTIGSRIRRVRKEKKLTQAQLASMVGISQSTLAELESGESKMPSSETLMGLAKQLGISQAWIMTGKDGEIEALSDEDHAFLTLAKGLRAEQRRAVYELMRSMTDEE